MIPNTFINASEWLIGCTGFRQGHAGDRQVEGIPAGPRMYHVETRLPNGKPAVLLDIGSVGNLVGDEWVCQQAAMGMFSGL